LRIPPLIQLFRPALAPTAAADVVAGAAFAASMGHFAPVLNVIAAATGSVCLYAAGMGLNGLVDRDCDANLHPGRPLVRHPELSRIALFLIVLLAGAGIALCTAAGAQWAAVVVLVLATAYNLGAKKTFPADAFVLGGARASNLWIGFFAAGAPFSAQTLTYALSYLLFIGGITIASRAEDIEPPRRRRRWLGGAFLPMAIGLGGLWSISGNMSWLFAVPGVVLVALVGHAILDGSRPGAMRFVLNGLLAIFLLHATLLATRGRWLALVPIVGLAVASFALIAMARKDAAATSSSDPQGSP